MSRTRPWLLATALVACRWLLAAQEPQEAPEYFLDNSKGDVPLVIRADGTWTSSFGAGWGQGWGPSGALSGVLPGGIEQGLVFSQVPDLTVSALLLNRYSFEVVYSGSVESNTFALGYQGAEGEWLRWVKAGNVPFSVPARASTSVAPGRSGNPALGAAFTFGGVSQELLLRFEDGAREVLRFRGFLPRDHVAVALTDWIRGRFFQLSLAGSYPALSVYLEDASQIDGYRLARGDEAVVFPATGEIRLAKPAPGKVYAGWTGHQPSLIYPLSGTTYELQDRYLLPASHQLGGQVIAKDATPLSGFLVTGEPGSDWFVVKGPVTPPFATLVPGLYAAVPAALGTPPVPKDALDFEILFDPEIAARTSWNLGADVLAESVVVTRNGFPTSEFTFEAAGGLLKPLFAVDDNDEIVVSFQRVQKTGKSPDVFAWQGGAWNTGEQSLAWNTWLRWNTVKDRFTSQELEAPGQVAATLQWNGQWEGFHWDWRLQGLATLPDSTSGRQLLGFGTTSPSVTLNTDALRPAQALPDTVLRTPFGLPALSRGITRYRDFFSPDPLTGTPTLATWKATVPLEPYSDGGSTGPYLALTPDGAGFRSAVLEAELGADEWAGLDVFLDSGRPRDLSATTRITLPLQLPQGLPADVRVFLVAGKLGEDFDGSGAVKTVGYQTHKVLPFRDSLRGYSLGFPLSEASTWTNDGAGDGSVQGAGDVVVWELIGLDATTKSVSVVPTESQRFALAATTGYSVLVVSSSTASPILFVGAASFEGTTWSLVPESVVSAVGTESLTPVDLPDSSGNTSSLAWTGRSAWTVEARMPVFHPREYKKLSFRYQLTGISPATTKLTLQVSDASLQGVEVSWDAPTSAGWQDATLDLSNGSLTVGSNVIPATKWANLSGAWDRVRLRQDGSSAGLLKLTPLTTSEPVWDFRVVSDATGRWSAGDSSLGVRLLQTQSQAAGLNWKAEAQAATHLGPTRWSGSATLDDASVFHGNYTAGLTLGLPEVGLGLDWQDHFSDQIARRETARLQLPVVGTFVLEAAATGDSLSLERRYDAQWTAFPGLPDHRMSMEAHALTAAKGTPVADLANGWTESWSWLTPVDQVQRSTSFSARLADQWTSGPLGLKGETQAQIFQLQGTPWKLSPTWSWKTSVPLTLANGTDLWAWEPYAEGKFSAVWDLVDGLRPSALPTSAWSLLKDQRDSGVLKTETGGGLTGSHAAFLTSGGVTVTEKSDLASAYQVTSATFQASDRAENLFGEVGLWPVFSAYRTDSLAWNVSATGSWGSRNEDNKGQVQALLQPEIYLTSRESVGLATRLAWASTDSTSPQWGLEPHWLWSGPANLPFVLPGWLSPTRFARELRFDTRLLIDVAQATATQPPLRRLDFRHKTTLALSPKSEAHLSLNLDQEWHDQVYLLGLQLVLDVVLSF